MKNRRVTWRPGSPLWTSCGLGLDLHRFFPSLHRAQAAGIGPGVFQDGIRFAGTGFEFESPQLFGGGEVVEAGLLVLGAGGLFRAGQGASPRGEPSLALPGQREEKDSGVQLRDIPLDICKPPFPIAHPSLFSLPLLLRQPRFDSFFGFCFGSGNWSFTFVLAPTSGIMLRFKVFVS